MKPCREVIIPLIVVECPYCGSEEREKKSGGSHVLAGGDRTRYERCADCRRRYRVRVTNDFHFLPSNGITGAMRQIGSVQK